MIDSIKKVPLLSAAAAIGTALIFLRMFRTYDIMAAAFLRFSLAAFIADVVRTANAIHKAFHPDKLNYGMYGDTGHHLHMHLVPKYKDQFEWGGTFAMDPNIKKLDEAQCEEVAAKLRAVI